MNWATWKLGHANVRQANGPREVNNNNMWLRLWLYVETFFVSISSTVWCVLPFWYVADRTVYGKGLPGLPGLVAQRVRVCFCCTYEATGPDDWNAHWFNWTRLQMGLSFSFFNAMRMWCVWCLHMRQARFNADGAHIEVADRFAPL